MNTYEWKCGGCETKNVRFEMPEDGKQITLTCKKCGAPWHLEEEWYNERIIRSLKTGEALASACSTSFQPPNYQSNVYKIKPIHWRY